jgi:hypothetical protein
MWSVNNNLNRRPAIDPAVADILADAERKKRLASLPKPERAKARKEAARHKVGLDLPPDLHEALRQIADKENVSISGLVAFLSQRGIDDYEAGKIDLFPHKRISRCARFEYVLVFEKNDE